ncbi:YrdB family protein [Agromyces aerolatus]|uniref:YrdB family protein n=1 Tax=Agromyces sp. LY-1074 TaxID=3074080 RepID=UPI002867197D|nr:MULTISPECIES: YrdB family protein [unclassified Agromyces]MDR5698279.1 YrdB family protein [Agromyces sp. LY-1074]MDR5704573.1 YrdB family protein [Agromyces sp. LY-1358]
MSRVVDWSVVTEPAPQPMPKIGPNDVLRFLLELFAFVTLAVWGFVAFPLPWPGVLIGIGAPLLAVLLWALFVSPRAVIRVDPFGKALVEIAVFSATAIAWWIMGQPVVAILTAVVAAVSGIINGRKELAG